MRVTPVARRGVQPGTQDFRVRFTRKFRDAKIVRESDLVPAVVTTPNPPLPQPAPQAPIPVPAIAVTPTEPTDFWTTDVGTELQADRERIEAALTSISEAVQTLRDERQSRIAEWQRAAIEFALTIASRVLRDRVVAGEFPVETQIREMIAQLSENEPVTVRLNPADLKILTDRLGGEPLSQERADLRFQADANLARGECQVESREGMMISDVTSEIQDIREELLRSLKNARS